MFNLVVRQCVQSLPVALDLCGDVFILEDDSGQSTLPPFWRRTVNTIVLDDVSGVSKVKVMQRFLHSLSNSQHDVKKDPIYWSLHCAQFISACFS